MKPLWKVTQAGWHRAPVTESRAKVHELYIPLARRRLRWLPWLSRTAVVWVDLRDGQGWQWVERIDLAGPS